MKLYYNLELSNSVYVAFLDSRKAFDTEWRKDLMYELTQLGVKGKLWQIIDDCHIETHSAIGVNQHQSRFFEVFEGVRQGGVLSGLLYLVFINDLLYDIERSNPNTSIINIISCAPGLADDISCIGNNMATVQRTSMLNVCFNYSRKWQFRFSAKSCIVRFLLNFRPTPVDYVWKIG